MGEDSEMRAPERYRAFISYSHADARFAAWLHRKLEHWPLPGQPRLTPIFIDHAELAAGPDLSSQVREALAGSAALIVLASPAARASQWVAQEVSLFRELHPGRPVLAALLEGEPAEAFPEPLLVHAGQAFEPLAADFRDGRDGKRLALLKILAGLTAQPLDRLVQRDAQSRQRRVMAITAGALLLSVILAAMLVVALRARAEAEHQRAAAEGLVEYMLTDLRQKLIGVGRLDVMQAVNERALGYYRAQDGLGNLPPDSLDRRSRVIEALGEDDENKGRIEFAYAKYIELHRVTEALLAKDSSNPDRIFAHANSENRLALIETTRGNVAQGYLRFRNAKALLARLPRTTPRPNWLALDTLVSGNLCAIALKASDLPAEAIGHCEQAVALAQARVQAKPADGQSRYDLSFQYFWLGKASDAAGDHPRATGLFSKSLATSDALVASDRQNMRWHEQHMELCFELAKAALQIGALADYARYISQAESDAAMLARHDPENSYWQDYRRSIAKLKRGATT